MPTGFLAKHHPSCSDDRPVAEGRTEGSFPIRSPRPVAGFGLPFRPPVAVWQPTAACRFRWRAFDFLSWIWGNWAALLGEELRRRWVPPTLD